MNAALRWCCLLWLLSLGCYDFSEDAACNHNEEICLLEVTGAQPSAGFPSGGDFVTLHGDGFVGETRVWFGGVEARVVSISADQVVVRSPPHEPGEVDVSLESLDRKAKSTARFRYVPPPEIYGLNPSSGQLGGELNVAIRWNNSSRPRRAWLGTCEVAISDVPPKFRPKPCGTEPGSVSFSIETDFGTDTLENAWEWLPGWASLGVPEAPTTEIRFDTRRPGRAFVLVQGQLFRTMDDGATWTRLAVKGVRGFAFDSRVGFEDVIHLMADDGVSVSPDGGTTWDLRSSETVGTDIGSLSVPTPRLVVLAIGTLMESVDDGASWSAVTGVAKASTTAMHTTAGKVFLGTTSGLQMWDPETGAVHTLHSNPVSSVATNADGSIILTGSGENGVHISEDGGATFRHLPIRETSVFVHPQLGALVGSGRTVQRVDSGTLSTEVESSPWEYDVVISLGAPDPAGEHLFIGTKRGLFKARL